MMVDEEVAAAATKKSCSSSSSSSSSSTTKLKFPSGVEQFRLYPEDGRHPVGFRLIGNRTMGVFISSILGGTVAEKEGKLETGDQLLQCHDIALAGLAADQVAKVVRLSFGVHGYALLTVAKKWARSEGHSYRPATPLQPSSTHHQLSSLAVHWQTKTRNSSLGDYELMSSTSQPSQLVTMTSFAQVHVEPKSANVPNDADSSHSANTVSTRTSSANVKASLTMEPVGRLDELLPKGGEPKRTIENDFPSLPNIPKENLLKERRQNDVNQENDKSTSGCPSRSPPAERSRSSVSQLKKCGSNAKKSRIGPAADDDDEANKDASYSSDELYNSISSPQTPPPADNDTPPMAQSRGKRTKEVDELPLIEMDQLNRKYWAEITPHNFNSRSTKKEQSRCKSPASDGSSRNSDSSGKRGKGSNELSWHCPVCLDGAKRIKNTQRKLISTPCGHVFCSACWKDVVNSKRLCPTCRAPVATDEAHPIFM